MKITAIVPAFQSVPGLVTARSVRESSDVDAFARAIGDELGIEVTIVEGSVDDVPATGYLLTFDLVLATDAQRARRIILVEADRSNIMKQVETYQLAAAIEKQRYFLWRTDRAAERGDGLVGRRDVAARMGARVATGPYTSAHYGLLASDSAADLPGLLAAYLSAYAEIAPVST